MRAAFNRACFVHFGKQQIEQDLRLYETHFTIFDSKTASVLH